MTGIPRAADLPEGSIVADRDRIYDKRCTDADLPWVYISREHGTRMYVNDTDDAGVDDALADGAQVLRHGYGDTVHAEVMTHLRQLDGTTAATVSMLTGLSRQEINDLGGTSD